jgi:hypothetical protein
MFLGSHIVGRPSPGVVRVQFLEFLQHLSLFFTVYLLHELIARARCPHFLVGTGWGGRARGLCRSPALHGATGELCGAASADQDSACCTGGGLPASLSATPPPSAARPRVVRPANFLATVFFCFFVLRNPFGCSGTHAGWLKHGRGGGGVTSRAVQ